MSRTTELEFEAMEKRLDAIRMSEAERATAIAALRSGCHIVALFESAVKRIARRRSGGAGEADPGALRPRALAG